MAEAGEPAAKGDWSTVRKAKSFVVNLAAQGATVRVGLESS